MGTPRTALQKRLARWRRAAPLGGGGIRVRDVAAACRRPRLCRDPGRRVPGRAGGPAPGRLVAAAQRAARMQGGIKFLAKDALTPGGFFGSMCALARS